MAVTPPGTKRLNIVVREELHKVLKIEAVKNDMTLGQYIEQALMEKLKREGIEIE